MFSKLQIVIFILVLSIVDAKRCNSCCSYSSANARANNFKKDLDKSSQENGMLKSKTITLGDNFALRVSTKDGSHIGWIHDEFNPSMSIPSNAQIHIEQRVACLEWDRCDIKAASRSFANWRFFSKVERIYKDHKRRFVHNQHAKRFCIRKFLSVSGWNCHFGF